MIFSRKRQPPHVGHSLPQSIVDDEFGVIRYKRTSSRYVRLRVNERGEVTATLPKRAPLAYISRIVESSRSSIRKLVAEQQRKRAVYEDGMRLGHSHTLRLGYSDVTKPSRRIVQQDLRLVLPNDWRGTESERAYISSQIKIALTKEAKAYLPRRLSYLAETYGFKFERIRYGNPRGRWGSCSSSGTISLNVALMNAPHDVIDYVLLHELAHTKHMNHSTEFWDIVAECAPDYKAHRKVLKSMSPIC